MIPVVLTLLHSVGIFRIDALDRLDAMIYDARLRLTMPQTFDDRIVIVDIDEKSLSELGHWPWSRNKLAALVDALFDHQKIALLGFDVVFAETDGSSGLKQLQRLARQELRGDVVLLKRLKKISPSLDYDAIFAKALVNRPVVLGYYFTSDRDGRTNGVLPQPVMNHLQNYQIPMTEWNGYGANIPQLAKAAPLAGFFNSITEPDGVVRTLPLVSRHAENCYESLFLAMFRQLLGMPSVVVGWLPGFFSDAGTQPGTLQHIVLTWPDKTFSIPVDQQSAMLVPYRGRGGAQGGSYQYVSASDVLAGRLPEGQLKGKIVLVGATAVGMVDARATPVDAVYPGIEVQANALSALLDRRFLIRPAHAESYGAILLLVIGLPLILIMPVLRAPVAVALSAAVLLGLMALNGWLYLGYSLVLSLAPLLLMILTICFLNMGYGFLSASRSRRELVQLFGTYVPTELVREMVKDPDHYSMQAKSEELTVMFCDMRGFTGMSERLDPVSLQQLLNQVFSELTRLIGANRGTVDKYMGDCVMAFWGAPVRYLIHAQLAVTTALQMSQALGRINQAHRSGVLASMELEIGLGIGINTGQMYVGDMGSDIRRSYTVIGDAVNLGSRLEGLSKVYGVNIVVSEATRLLAPGFVWQELDIVRVKGKAQATAIFTPLAAMGELGADEMDELALWHRFLTTYRAQDRVLCDDLMAQLRQRNRNNTLYQLYAQRLSLTCEQPIDPTWDGITNFEAK